MATFKEYKDYSGLTKKNEYDKKKAELFAEACTELIEIEKRKAYLEELLSENSDLKPFMWTTLEGETKPLHKIDDDHLRNILGHIINRGGMISQELKAEALSRNITIPDQNAIMAKRLLEAREAEILDDYEDIWND